MSMPLPIRLNEAIEGGDAKEVSRLLSEGADPNGFGNQWRDRSEQLEGPCEPPLFLAAWLGDLALVEILLAAGAEVDARVWSSRLLRKSRASFFADDCPPLVAACGRGHAEVVAALVRGGAEPGWISPKGRLSGLMAAFDERHHEIVKQLVERHGLSLAAERDRRRADELIHEFLRKGAIEMFPWAVDHGLLDGLADREVDERWCEFHWKRGEAKPLIKRLRSMDGIETLIPSRTGATALCYACQLGDTALAEALFGAGADLNPPSDHDSPLTSAAINDRPEVVRWLVEHGGDSLLLAAGSVAIEAAEDLGERKMAENLKKQIIEAEARSAARG